MAIKINLAEDLRQHFLKMFKDGGFLFNTKASVEEVVRQYFNLRLRTIEPKSRRVHTSKELDARTLPEWIKKSIDQLSARSEAGENLIGHLSEKIVNPDYKDPLLNDWGIHHFHLGLSVKPNSAFYERTNELLYAKVTETDLYLIDVLDHDAVESFANRTLLEIIHSNWPHSIKLNRIGGILEGEDLKNSEIDELRKSGISTTHKMADGTTYAPIGGGYATDGSNVQVTMMSNRLLNFIWSIEQAAIENEDKIRAAFIANNRSCPSTLKLKLQSYDETGATLIEPRTGLAFVVPTVHS